MTRMAYLTLRGISVARALGTIDADLSIVEVHPGAAMAARGAPVEDVRALKGDADARARLLDWLGTQGLDDLDALTLPTDHDVAAAAAALAAWRWRLGEATFCHRADPPLHPFDVAC
jgi:predicted nuclease with RNAse H fold